LANYFAAAQLAEREGQSQRQAAAAERARSLGARVSKLTVVVPPELLSLPGFHLLRDGIEFERASFGIPIPIDGGTHAFIATAPNRAPWSSTVTLYSERDQKTLVLPILDAAQAMPSKDVAALEVDDSKRQLRVAAFAVGAGGALALGAATVFALSAVSKNNQSNADGNCGPGGCGPRGTELRNEALSAARVSTWSFVAGGLLLSGGVTLYAISLSSKSSATSSSLSSLPPSSSVPTTISGGVAYGAPSLVVTGSF
jgi:hypothetical protein